MGLQLQPVFFCSGAASMAVDPMLPPAQPPGQSSWDICLRLAVHA